MAEFGTCDKCGADIVCNSCRIQKYDKFGTCGCGGFFTHVTMDTCGLLSENGRMRMFVQYVIDNMPKDSEIGDLARKAVDKEK